MNSYKLVLEFIFFLHIHLTVKLISLNVEYFYENNPAIQTLRLLFNVLNNSLAIFLGNVSYSWVIQRRFGLIPQWWSEISKLKAKKKSSWTSWAYISDPTLRTTAQENPDYMNIQILNPLHMPNPFPLCVCVCKRECDCLVINPINLWVSSGAGNSPDNKWHQKIPEGEVCVKIQIACKWYTFRF